MFLIKNSLKKVLVLSLATLTSAQALAGTSTITFDEISQNLVHGSVLNAQYSGVNITANNPNRAHNLAVIYDTTPNNPANNGLDITQYDPDLEGPNWAGSNLQSEYGINPNSYNAGNAVIIQENNIGCGDGVCNFPDDELGRPAGTLTFDFDFDVNSFGFDLIDFENVEQLNSSVTFFNGSGASNVFQFSDFLTSHSAVFGNNTLNRIWIDTLGLTNVNRAVFNFGGSGAVDTIAYERTPTTQVSEPSTIALFALAILGYARLRRRA